MQVVSGVTGLMLNEEAVRKYVCHDDDWRKALIDLLNYRENYDADTLEEDIHKLLEVVTCESRLRVFAFVFIFIPHFLLLQGVTLGEGRTGHRTFRVYLSLVCIWRRIIWK